MTILSATATSPTAVTLGLSSVPAATVAIQVQYSLKHDFNWSLSPIIQYDPATSYNVVGLNQAGGYYWRARALDTAGAPLEAWSNVAAVYTPLQAARVLTPAPVMIEPALLVPRAHILQWWGSSEVDGYPARVLNRDEPNTIWMARQSGGVVALDVQTTGEPIDTVALLRTTAAENATIKVSAGSSRSAAISSPSYTTGVVPFRASANLPARDGYHAFVRLPAPVSAPFWRIEVGGDTPGGIFAATYAVFGLARSVKNYSTDKGETLIDRGSVDRDRSGALSRVRGHRGRTVDFELSVMTEAQYESQIEPLRWMVGTTEPILVLPNSKAGPFLHDRLLYGQLAASRASNPFSPRFTQPLKIDSLI